MAHQKPRSDLYVEGERRLDDRCRHHAWGYGLLDRSKEAKDGDIVIAEIDGAWTMKYLKKNGKNVMLLPANKKYKPIIRKRN